MKSENGSKREHHNGTRDWPPWPNGTTISNAHELVSALLRLSDDPRQFCFRGNANATYSRSGLYATIDRPFVLDNPNAALDNETVERVYHIENILRQQWIFRTRRTFRSSDAGHLLRILAMMQHHGAPTRLLDWTRSPLIGAYFAARTEPNQDGEIVFFDHQLQEVQTLEKLKTDKKLVAQQKVIDDNANHTDTTSELHLVRAIEFLIVEKFEAPLVFPLLHFNDADRIVHQRAMFTIATEPLQCHARLIAEMLSSRPLGGRAQSRGSGSPPNFGRIVVASTVKRALMKLLHSMNIHASSLFPGPDGVGSMLQEVTNWSDDARGPFATSQFVPPIASAIKRKPVQQDQPNPPAADRSDAVAPNAQP